MNNQISKKDTSVEWIRIIGCIMVVGAHVRLGNFDSAGQLNRGCLYISCLLADGVSIFWLIAGFFMFQGSSFTNKLKSLLKRIIIPTVIYLVFAQMIEAWISDPGLSNFRLSISNINLINIVKGFLSQNTQMFSYGIHLWYVFTYSVVVLMYPLLKCLCNSEAKTTDRARHYVIFMSLILILLSELQLIVRFPVSIASFSMLASHALFVVIGYELSRHKEKIKSVRYMWLYGLAVFFLVNIIRMFAQGYLYNIDISNERYLFWNSIFGFLSSVSLFCGVYSINVKGKVVDNIALHVGKCTFEVYLIHLLVMYKLNALGLRDWLLAINKGEEGHFIDHLAFTAEYTVIVFLVSLLICILGRMFLIFVKKLTNKIANCLT